MKNKKTSFKEIKEAIQINDKDLLRVRANLPTFSVKVKYHERVIEIFKALESVSKGSLISVDHISELADINDFKKTRRAIQRAKKEFVSTIGKVIYNKAGVGYKVADDNEALEESVKGMKRGLSHFNNTSNAQHNCNYKYNNLNKAQKKDKKLVEMLTEILDVISQHQSKQLDETMKQMKLAYNNKLTKAKKE